MPLLTSRNAVTLLVVTDTEVIRADCKTGPRPVIKSLHRAERPPQTPVGAAAELAVSLSDAKPSARTVLVAEDFWSGALDLDERSIYGLEGEDLTQMLRFETESLSNLDPMGSHLDAVELAPVSPDTRRFWCLGVSADVLNSCATSIGRRGGKLVQLAHPLGLSSPVSADQPWVEFQQTLAGAFSIPEQGLPRVAVAPRSKTSDRWYRALLTSFGSELPPDGWIGPDADTPEGFAGSLQTLEGNEAIQRWIAGAVQRLTESKTMPAVVPPGRPTSARTLTTVGMAAAMLTAIACGAHFAHTSWTKSLIGQQLAELEQTAAEKQKLDANAKQLEEQTAKLQEEVKSLQVEQSELAAVTARGDRFSELLRLVAAARDENLVVDEITGSASGLQ